LKDYYLFIDAVIGQDTWLVSLDQSSPDAWRCAQNADLTF